MLRSGVRIVFWFSRAAVLCKEQRLITSFTSQIMEEKVIWQRSRQGLNPERKQARMAMMTLAMMTLVMEKMGAKKLWKLWI